MAMSICDLTINANYVLCCVRIQLLFPIEIIMLMRSRHDLFKLSHGFAYIRIGHCPSIRLGLSMPSLKCSFSRFNRLEHRLGMYSICAFE